MKEAAPHPEASCRQFVQNGQLVLGWESEQSVDHALADSRRRQPMHRVWRQVTVAPEARAAVSEGVQPVQIPTWETQRCE